MAWPESLTTDQQKTVTDFTLNLRAFASQLSQLNVLASSIGAAWSGGINTLVGTLQAGDVIPNTSGLAGSQDLSQADVTNLANWAATICSSTNAVQGTGSFGSLAIQQTCVKAAGIDATT